MNLNGLHSHILGNPLKKTMIFSGLQSLPAAEVLRSELRDSEGLDALNDPMLWDLTSQKGI